MDSNVVVKDLMIKCGIQEILDLDGITEVAVNQPNRIFFDRGNGWEHKDDLRCSFDLCYKLAKALSVFSNDLNSLSISNPFASVILPNGERGQIMIPPATEDECVSFTFRKPSLKRFTLDDYNNTGRLSNFNDVNKSIKENSKDEINEELFKLKNDGKIKEFFTLAIKSYKNILIVGGTGSGKTAFMKALTDLYPIEDRIFTVEDVHELDLPLHYNHVHLYYKNNTDLTPQKVIESCMRMKPDHILLAELRGAESWSYLEALNTGHAGSITTIHANDCLSAHKRLADLVKQSEVGKSLDYEYILQTVKSSIDVICFFKHTEMEELYFNYTNN